MEERQARLENWYMESDQTTSYTPPELEKTCLKGDVFNHPSFEDGKFIHTSYLIGKLDFENMKAQTKNTLYILGQPYKP